MLFPRLCFGFQCVCVCVCVMGVLIDFILWSIYMSVMICLHDSLLSVFHRTMYCIEWKSPCTNTCALCVWACAGFVRFALCEACVSGLCVGLVHRASANGLFACALGLCAMQTNAYAHVHDCQTVLIKMNMCFCTFRVFAIESNPRIKSLNRIKESNLCIEPMNWFNESKQWIEPMKSNPWIDSRF